MHAGGWNPGALSAALSAMQDEGLSQGDIAKLAGVNRSQVNRWARGEHRPAYDRALRLARATAARMPAVAARFMTAAGYTWDGRADPAPEREPPIPPDLLALIRRRFPPDKQQEAIDALEDILLPPTESGEGDPARRRRRVS